LDTRELDDDPIGVAGVDFVVKPDFGAPILE
jgi:hypothetical protein